jgi:hypothetical protein
MLVSCSPLNVMCRSHSTVPILFTMFINCIKDTKKEVKSLFLTNLALRHEGVWGSGCIDPYFLYLGTSWL